MPALIGRQSVGESGVMEKAAGIEGNSTNCVSTSQNPKKALISHYGAEIEKKCDAADRFYVLYQQKRVLNNFLYVLALVSENREVIGSLSESDIIDVLLGQATPEIEGRVREEVQANREFAASYERWAEMLISLRHENAQAKSIADNVISRTMAQLTKQRDKEPDRVPAPLLIRFTSWVGEKQWAGWRGLKIATYSAVTVCVFLTIIFLTQFSSLHTIESQRPDETEALSDSSRQFQNKQREVREARQIAKYVKFDSLDSAKLGTESQPFSTLTEGIEALPPGGVLGIKSGRSREILRIATPVTLVAVDGAVQIGVH